MSKAVYKNALPAMATMLMILVYNLADTFFIGQTGDALLVAAVSVATPVFLLFVGVGTIFGIGGTSAISRALGSGKPEYARKVSAFCLWGSVVVGSVMSAVMLLLVDQILEWVGSTPNIWDPARTYLVIVTCSGPFAVISTAFSNIVRTEGKSVQAMMGSVIGNVVNIVLDPILILGIGGGIAGAAVATVAGNVIGALYYIVYLGRRDRKASVLSIRLQDVTLKDHILQDVGAIGVPAALGSILMSVSQILINACIAVYGDMAVAGVGVAMKVVMIVGIICMGLGQGVQPLFGYLAGARNWPRFRSVMRFSLVFALLVGGILCLFCYVFCDELVGVFLTDQAAYSYGVDFAQVLLASSAIVGVFCVLLNAMQGMDATLPALITSTCRQGILFIPTIYVLAAWMGMNGVVWTPPLVDAVSLAVAIILYRRSARAMMSSHTASAVGLA